uniref:Zgc:113227 n=1 Tax=Sander lucioperca TaxID=283035 RepID=A0A8C9XNI3_SANLU
CSAFAECCACKIYLYPMKLIYNLKKNYIYIYFFLSLQAILQLKARRRSPNFRVSPESFEYICSHVKHAMGRRNTNYRLCVPIRKRVAIAIWKLATGGEYRTISHLFGVGLSTVFNCVQEFCNTVITVLLPVHIKFPDAEKLLEMATFFNNRWRVPQCVGAIDGSHIPIIPRLAFYCSAKQLWMSPSLANWLMKPFSDTGRLTTEQHTYNYRLSSARLVVEMSFRRLKGRWRCLLKRNDCKLELSKRMALTCCVLHNICEEHGDNFTEEHPDRTLNIEPPVQTLPEGADIRAALMMHFNRGNEGFFEYTNAIFL